MGGVGILALEQLVETVLGAGGRGGHIVAEPAEARPTDRDEQSGDRLHAVRQVGDPLLDQIGSGQEWHHWGGI